MKVIPTQNGDVAVAQAADVNSADDTKTASFKAALAQAEDLPTGVKLHKGETAKHVEGHAYYEITSGDREGMFINTRGNVRNGEAFVLVEKADFNFHIYGSGDDRVVIRANKREVD